MAFKKAKPKDIVHCRYFAVSNSSTVNKIFPANQFESITGKAAKRAKDNFLYVANEEVVRFSKNLAEECAAFVRLRILAGAYDDQVPRLSDSWLKRKAELGYIPHVGTATLEMASSISAFRTNTRSSGDTKHTGYVVGIRQTAGGMGGDYLRPSAKQLILEFGRKSYTHGNLFGKGITHEFKAQPARPIFKLAILDFLNAIGVRSKFAGTATYTLTDKERLNLLKNSIQKRNSSRYNK